MNIHTYSLLMLLQLLLLMLGYGPIIVINILQYLSNANCLFIHVFSQIQIIHHKIGCHYIHVSTILQFPSHQTTLISKHFHIRQACFLRVYYIELMLYQSMHVLLLVSLMRHYILHFNIQFCYSGKYIRILCLFYLVLVLLYYSLKRYCFIEYEHHQLQII